MSDEGFTEDVMDEISEFINDDILSRLLEKEKELSKRYPEGHHCPYYESLLAMYYVNKLKGWDDDMLYENLSQFFDDKQTTLVDRKLNKLHEEVESLRNAHEQIVNMFMDKEENK